MVDVRVDNHLGSKSSDLRDSHEGEFTEIQNAYFLKFNSYISHIITIRVSGMIIFFRSLNCSLFDFVRSERSKSDQ